MSESQEVAVKPQASQEAEGEQNVVASAQEATVADTAAGDTEAEEKDQSALDDLGEIEFLLDEIEDQIAPLAL